RNAVFPVPGLETRFRTSTPADVKRWRSPAASSSFFFRMPRRSSTIRVVISAPLLFFPDRIRCADWRFFRIRIFQLNRLDLQLAALAEVGGQLAAMRTTKALHAFDLRIL